MFSRANYIDTTTFFLLKNSQDTPILFFFSHIEPLNCFKYIKLARSNTQETHCILHPCNEFTHNLKKEEHIVNFGKKITRNTFYYSTYTNANTPTSSFPEFPLLPLDPLIGALNLTE